MCISLLEILKHPEHHLRAEHVTEEPRGLDLAAALVTGEVFMLWVHYLSQQLHRRADAGARVPAAPRRARPSLQHGFSGLLSSTKYGKFRQSILSVFKLLRIF